MLIVDVALMNFAFSGHFMHNIVISEAQRRYVREGWRGRDMGCITEYETNQGGRYFIFHYKDKAILAARNKGSFLVPVCLLLEYENVPS